ncbi:MAG: ABC transporter ATP-binding protein/permease [Acholeplasmatales bacterium]|jgi:ATP-binding cassette subfamily B protein|nr:ABC transporter ATP-binding protein/permease [Acholeplasmatales bacterium]
MFEEEDYTESKLKLSVWKKILKVVVSSKKRIIVLIIASIFIGLLDVLNQQLIRWALSEFVSQTNLGSNFITFLILAIAQPLVFGVFVFLFISKAGEIEAYTSYELRKQSFENLQRLSFSYYDKTQHGWLMARLTSDSRKLSNILSWGLVDLIWTLAYAIFILIMLFISDWRLALGFLVVLPIMFLISFAINRKILKQNRIARRFNSQSTAKYNEAFMGAKTTKSLNIEETSRHEYEDISKNLRKSTIRAVAFSSMFISVLLTISYIVVGVLYVVGGKMVIAKIVPYTTIYLFISYTVSLLDPVMQLSRSVTLFLQAGASAERVIGLIETKPDLVDTPEVIKQYGDLLNDHEENWEDIAGKIEFKDVTFYYKSEEIVLDNFSLEIKAGSTVALVGHTGSGKSTIVNLISRFYQPKSGTILIDDVDYQKRSIHWLHKRLGYVLQAPQLFSQSILENIRYGRLEASDEECIAAAKIIGAADFIERLAEGYQTLVGEGGNSLSVGEKQLISFARAILANPRILILDEATSSIDSQAEAIIQEATKIVLANRTNIVVAHRLSTIINADLIIVMDKGRIAEKGTHKELINQRGLYFELYKNQFMQERLNSLEENI